MAIEIHFVNTDRFGPPAIAMALHWDNVYGDESYAEAILILPDASVEVEPIGRVLTARNRLVPADQMLPVARAARDLLIRDYILGRVDPPNRPAAATLLKIDERQIAGFRALGLYRQLGSAVLIQRGNEELSAFVKSVAFVRGLEG